MIWELPQNLIGAIFKRICKKHTVSEGVYKGKQLIKLKNVSWGLSLGKYIFVTEYANAYLIKHEFGHCLQSEKLGWFYLLIVGVPSFFLAGLYSFRLIDRATYNNSFPEKWADELGGNV